MREEEKQRSSQGSGFKRFMKKRWAFPAIYLASAAIILTAVLWYQNSNNASDEYDYSDTDVAEKKYDEPSVEVTRSMENFVMPVANQDSVEIQKQFYDYTGKKEEQEAALVFYNNTYHPNTGIDIAQKDGESFEVKAALSGTVTRVDEDALLGNVIEIEHDKGIVTQYQSVTDVSVKQGDQVEQGQALAKAGQSLFNEEAGVHVHFEIRKDNVPVNPLDYFNKPLSALQEAAPTDNTGAADDSGAAEENDSDAAAEGEEADDAATETEESADEKKAAEDDKAAEDKEDENAGDKEDQDKNNSGDQEEESTDSSDASLNNENA